MTYVLLLLTVATAVATAYAMVRVTDKLVAQLIGRIVEDPEVCAAWTKYVRLAVYIMGITGGANVYQLERYLSGSRFDLENSIGPRIAVEIYRAFSEAAQAIIWLLLPVFLVFLIIGEVRKVLGVRKAEKAEEQQDATGEEEQK